MEKIKYNPLILMLLCGLFLLSCGKMDATYEKFIEDGEIIYIGLSDSVTAAPGLHRVKLSWTLPSDPKITKTKVYWNDRLDSSVVVYDHNTTKKKNHNLIITELNEGLHTFEVYNLDEIGNSSVKTTVSSRAYGEVYSQSLYLRPVKGAAMVDADGKIDWAGANIESFGSEVYYTNSKGEEKTVFVASKDDVTILPDFTPNAHFTFRSLYLPDPMSIDTFYTSTGTQLIRGNPVELSKEAWSIIASSEDKAGGRPATNLIDNNHATVWVNQLNTVPPKTYPHTVTITLKDDVTLKGGDGFVFVQRSSLAGALKLLEIQVSKDGTTWSSLGDFTLLSVTGNQFIETKDPYTFRHFKVICKADYSNTNNVPLAEIGLFKR